jgi:hypothetical protein
VPGVLEIDKCFVRKMGWNFMRSCVGVDGGFHAPGMIWREEVKDVIKQTNRGCRCADYIGPPTSARDGQSGFPPVS